MNKKSQIVPLDSTVLRAIEDVSVEDVVAEKVNENGF